MSAATWLTFAPKTLFYRAFETESKIHIFRRTAELDRRHSGFDKPVPKRPKSVRKSRETRSTSWARGTKHFARKGARSAISRRAETAAQARERYVDRP